MPQVEVKPSCVEFSIIHPNRGKPNVSVDDIQEQLKRSDDPIGHVRNFVGDTKQTLESVDEHNAAYHTVCD